jgi:beta-lactamase regulating signal transducer with metallopeptidase domain
MIATWMLYALAIAVLLGVAAFIAERALLRVRRATRFVWIAALVASFALPATALLREPTPQQRVDALVAIASDPVPTMTTRSPLEILEPRAIRVVQTIDIDRWLTRGWLALSSIVLALYAVAWLGLRRRVRDARVVTLAGQTVRVTRDAGPAVIGFWRPTIIVPHWLIDTDASTQALVIAHERQHLLARDSQLYMSALTLLVLMPWNAPLWWQVRRLRIAIEIDCDARVLRTTDRQHYGAALVEVACRTLGLRGIAPALGESGAALERRVRIMQSDIRTDRASRVAVGLLAACAIAAVAVAADVTPPPAHFAFVADRVDERGVPILPSPVAELNASQAAMAEALRELYPQLATTQYSGTPVVSALLNERGTVAQSHLEILPKKESPEFSSAYWQSLLQRFNVSERHITQQIVIEVPVGANRVAVAWIMNPGATITDEHAPRFTVNAPTGGSRAETEARVLAQVAAHEAVIAHFAPEALERGVSTGQELWFLMDADGKVLRSGVRLRVTDPDNARKSLESLFPGISVAYVVRGTGVKDKRGVRVPVSWHWLERGSQEPKAPGAI